MSREPAARLSRRLLALTFAFGLVFPAAVQPKKVVFAEMLATPKREMGAVICPLRAVNVSLERCLPVRLSLDL
jgi:hypothetical protein